MARYKLNGSLNGYIENPIEIEQAKFNNFRHVVLGCMLGDFDEVGEYIVDKEIEKELIAMPKFLVEKIDNIEIFQGELILDKPITFAITFENDKATLSLLEKINFEANFKLNSGIYSNINEYVLDAITTSGEIDRNLVYRKWHISDFGGKQLNILDCDEATLQKYFGLVRRFKYLVKANTELLKKEDLIETLEAEYTDNILEILNRYPSLKSGVEADIKKAFIEHNESLQINKPNFVKTLNEVIDNSINSNLSNLDEKARQEFTEERLSVLKNLTINEFDLMKLNKNKVRYFIDGRFIDSFVNVVPVDNNQNLQDIIAEFSNVKKLVAEKIHKRNIVLNENLNSTFGKVISAIETITGLNLYTKIVQETKETKTENLVNSATKSLTQNKANTAEKKKTAENGKKAEKSGANTSNKTKTKETKTKATKEENTKTSKQQGYTPSYLYNRDNRNKVNAREQITNNAKIVSNQETIVVGDVVSNIIKRDMVAKGIAKDSTKKITIETEVKVESVEISLNT